MVTLKNYSVHSLRLKRSLIVALICCGVCSNGVYSMDAATELMLRETIEQGKFIQIPGPNPIIRPGPESAWDDLVVEAADAFEEKGKYYFYYHATDRRENSYELGVATAKSPLGPFKKHGDKPVLEVGPEGSWDEEHVACAMIVRAEDEEDDTYYMWYSGCDKLSKWSIGLATGPSPVGPWKKYEGNPVVDDFGYMGGALKVDGKYRLYTAWPINTPWSKSDFIKSRSLDYHSDYSPLAVAIGDKPEGPFTKYPRNPLMVRGEPGDWDDGGISEAEVLYDNGMFHMFYGAVRTFGPRIESVGYAYSFDGFKWYKYGRNPVATYHANPGAAAFAEIHAIIERPFIYVYHTLRPIEHGGESYPWNEDLGVQVLVTQTPFSLDMPALTVDSLDAGKTTALADAPPICLSNITRLSLSAECRYGKKAKKPIRVHVRASSDGLKYDTADLYTLDNDLQPGKLARKTFEVKSKVRFIKVMLENLDGSESVSDVKIIATLGS